MMIVAAIVLSTVSAMSAGFTMCTAIKMHVSMSAPLLFVSIWYQGITWLVKSYFKIIAIAFPLALLLCMQHQNTSGSSQSQ